jgi:hypothetical protein
VWRTILLWAGPVLEVAILGGLIVRRRVRRAYLLPVFLVALMLPNALIGIEPAINTWRFWSAKEALHALLAFALGLELAWRIFGHLPGAAHAAKRWILLVAVLSIALVFAAPAAHPALSIVPRLLVGTAWLYTGIALTMLRFMLPIDPLHKAILLGFAPYMMLYAATWGRVKGPATLAVANVVNPLMFVGVMVALLLAAWRDEPAPPAPPALVRFVWPWR